MKVKEKVINLLPKVYRQAEKVKRRFIITSGLLVLEVIGFMSFVVIPPKHEILETQKQLEQLTEKINNETFSKERLMLQQLEMTQEDVNAWRTLYNKLKHESFVSSYVLEGLVSWVPLEVTINQLTIMPEVGEDGGLVKTIRIEGIARAVLSVLNYITVIEENFGLETISYEVTDGEEGIGCHYIIHITIPVESVEGGVDE